VSTCRHADGHYFAIDFHFVRLQVDVPFTARRLQTMGAGIAADGAFATGWTDSGHGHHLVFMPHDIIILKMIMQRFC